MQHHAHEPPPGTANDEGAPPTHSGRAVALLLVGGLGAALVAGGVWLASARRAALSESVADRLEQVRRDAEERLAAAERQRVASFEARAGAGAPRPASQPPLALLPAASDPAFGDAVRSERDRLAAAVEGADAQRAETYAQLAYVLARGGDGPAAVEVANRALDLDPVLAAGWLARAHGWLAQGELPRATEDAARAERLAPAAPGLWLLRGEVAFARGEREPAVAAYRRALEGQLPGSLAEHARARLAALEAPAAR